MPNRIIRDWTDSEVMNSLSIHAERFFTRLIMKVDDYGCFHASEKVLRISLFPFLIDSIREADITRWLAECHDAGLILLYNHESKLYLQINNFGQTLRQKKEKYPLPEKCASDDKQAISIRASDDTLKGKERKQETKGKEVAQTSFESIYLEITNSERWIEETAMTKRLSKESVKEKLVYFLNDLKLKDDYHKGYGEIKKHFIGWLNIDLSKKKFDKPETVSQMTIGSKNKMPVIPQNQ